MPYKRRFRRRRRRKAWYDRKYSAGQLASKAWSGVKYLKKIVNVEKKIHDTSIAEAVSSTGAIHSLHDVAQGDTINTRDGNSLKGLYLGFRMGCTQNLTATQSLIRVMVVADKQQIGDAEPSVGNILQSAVVTSYLNEDTLGRFSVLYDKVFTMAENSDSLQKYAEWNHNFEHRIRYNGAAATDIQKNGLFMLLLSDEATNTPTVAITVRLRFVDN